MSTTKATVIASQATAFNTAYQDNHIDFANYRSELRNLFSQKVNDELRAKGYGSTEIKDRFADAAERHNAALVAEGLDGAIPDRSFNLSGVRDRLSTDAMSLYLLDLYSLDQLLETIANPTTQLKGGGTANGFVLGVKGTDFREVADLTAIIQEAYKHVKDTDTMPERETGQEVDELINAGTADLIGDVASKYSINEGMKGGVNTMLQAAGLPDIETLLSEIDNGAREVVAAREQAEELKRKMGQLASSAATTMKFEAPEHKDEHGKTVLPKGRVVMKKAHEALGLTKGQKVFDFDVPVWEWDGDHPHVPDVDEHYIFRPSHLMQILWALITNKKTWISGPTGTGKSTLVEQICARLNWPMLRINFDSEITRLDLIGRDVLSNDGGTTTSRFVDGILPQAMQGPYVLLCDEVDFIRPEVAYVFQRALEDKGLLITEDGGRLVTPHPMFRMIATANTQGQGDDLGLYQGARPQSMAFLDRFTVWVDVQYLSQAEEQQLLESKVPFIDADDAKLITKYVGEHRRCFMGAEIAQPLSPRGVLALGEAMATFTGFYPNKKDAVKMALDSVILNRASNADKAVIRSLVDRVFMK